MELKQIVNLIDQAFENGRKYPKIALATANGQRIVLGRAGDKSKYPGSVNVTDGGRYGDNKWFGRIGPDGYFYAAAIANADVTNLLSAFNRDPRRVAKRYSLSTGACCFCAKELTDERSIQHGYGPTCAKKYSLPWGTVNDDELLPEHIDAPSRIAIDGCIAVPTKGGILVVVASAGERVFIHKSDFAKRASRTVHKLADEVSRAGSINPEHWREQNLKREEGRAA